MIKKTVQPKGRQSNDTEKVAHEDEDDTKRLPEKLQKGPHKISGFLRRGGGRT